jgi:hypothetical protein
VTTAFPKYLDIEITARAGARGNRGPLRQDDGTHDAKEHP